MNKLWIVAIFLLACGRGPGSPPPAPDAVGAADSTPAVESKVLPLPLDGQGTPLWCWAASGEMILSFFGEPVSQCRQATERYGKKQDVDCCDPLAMLSEESKSACVRGGWPQFEAWGYRAENTKNACEPADHCALGWDELRRQIDQDRPVAFSWRYEGGGGHMMVAIGYVLLPPDERYVVVHDPWPPGSGDAELITYERYVDGPYQHWRDYYDIVPAAEEEG